ncbi:MAG: nucleotide exchange factor GrpE [Myxococcales bacterium]|nr:nucleotide exchange factor GrpE [Myxococcales bacterium]
MRSPPGNKGNFSTDIGQDLIDEALKAVEKRTKGDAGDPGDQPDEAAAAPSTPSAPEAAPAPEGDAKAQATGKDQPTGQAQEVEQLKAELELSLSRGRDLMQKLKDEHEKMLRAAADLENYKKRAQKEKEEVQRFGSEKLLKDLLPVSDNFDRALDASSASDFDSFKKGVGMIRKLFEDALGKHGVKGFSAKGEVFDPTRHEAMSAVDTTDLPPNHVHTEVLRGFTLNDRLVRPALVVVSRAPEKPPEAPAAAQGPPPEGSPGGEGGATS